MAVDHKNDKISQNRMVGLYLGINAFCAYLSNFRHTIDCKNSKMHENFIG